MVKHISKKSENNICFQCGFKLLFVSKETVKPDGNRFPQINIVYRCSNVECQEKKDKEKVDRLILQQKKAEITRIRTEERLEKRKLTLKSKVRKI